MWYSPDYQHGTLGLVDEFVGDASQEESGHTFSSVRPNHEQIGLQGLGLFKNGKGGVTQADD
jgi:hypothetical protein